MRFYFKKESLKRRLSPIYWQELYSFIEKQSENTTGTDYAHISYGEDEKTCLLYENLAEKPSYHCDFYIALDPNLKIPKEDFYLSSMLVDEQKNGHKTVCLLPTGTSLKGLGKAEELWIITEENGSELSKLLQREVCSVAKLHGLVNIFTSEDFEKLHEADLRWDHCKKLISFSKNKALNHWLCILLGEDFILHSDDAASPIRYAETNIKHPFLKEFGRSEYDEACFYKYDIWTSALRKLNVQLCEPQHNANISWGPQEALSYLAQQCLEPKHENTNTLFGHLKSQECFLPFALPKWQEHKNSLPQLMNFVQEHPQNSNMQQLLVTYLLNFLPPEHWYKIEHFFAAQDCALDALHTTVDILAKKFDISCSMDFAYGTYIRAIRDEQKYTCGWKQNLATCFDFVLNQNFEKILEVAEPQIKKKALSGVKLTKLLLIPLLVSKRNIPKGLISICQRLIASENTNGENIYGESIFYRSLLHLLDNNPKALVEFLDQDFEPIKTQGYLGCLGLFLLKYDARYAEIGKRLLAIEKMELLAKKPLALQTKAWGMLTMGNKEAYETCAQILSKEKTYFKRYNTFPEKWFIQSKIEATLGHSVRAKRFRFMHNRIGMSPCIWEMFE